MPEIPRKAQVEYERLLGVQEQAESSPGLWPAVVAGWESFVRRKDVVGKSLWQAYARGNLAYACLSLYELTGDDHWARRAGKLLDTLLLVFTRSTDPGEWATTQHNLGRLYASRYERNGDDTDASQAEQHFRAALEEYRREVAPDDWAALQQDRGTLYASRYERNGTEADAAQAEQLFWAALEEFRLEVAPADWAALQSSLGTLYGQRYERSGAETDAVQAEQHYRTALTEYLRGIAPAQWAGMQHNLGNLYSQRYERSGAEADAVHAEQHYGAALEVFRREIAPTDWALVQHSLGRLYADRYEHSGADADAIQAEQSYQAAQSEYPREIAPADWAALQGSLGNLYSSRYEHSRADADAFQAEQYFQAALAEHRREVAPAQWAMTQENLGNLYSARYRQRNGAEADAIQAEQHYRAALEEFLQEVAPAQWAGVQNNLGNLYAMRYERGGADANVGRAEQHFQAALTEYRSEVAPAQWADVQHSLGNLYSESYQRSRADADADRAQSRYELVLAGAGQHALPQSYVFFAARALARLQVYRHAWLETTIAYEKATDALGKLYAPLISRANKEAWLREAQGLAVDAAYALAKRGQLEQAVEVLEAGRARLLAEALDQHRRDLEQLEPKGHGDLLARYRAAAERFDAIQLQAGHAVSQPSKPVSGPLDFVTLRQQMAAVRGELDEAIAAIRQIRGYTDFFRSPRWEQISECAQPSAPLVYLVAAPVGGLALVVRRHTSRESGPAQVGATAVWLDQVTESQLPERIFGTLDGPAWGGYVGAYDLWLAQPRNEVLIDAWHAALDEMTRWLWDAAMRSIVGHLTAAGIRQAILIPTGLLGLLPLHAAWTPEASMPTGRRYALDDAAFTYAPSARALVAARQTADEVAPDRLLAIANPDRSLSFSEQEVSIIQAHFPTDCVEKLQGREANRTAVREQLAQYPVLHFSTHGRAGWTEPLEGGLQLADKQYLSVAEILDLRLDRARLAVLSACETGIPGTDLPDEVIGLPSALLQAGVAGVVASLWSVNDLSTAMLIERFYRFWRDDRLEPALALRQAQQWLRDTSNGEKLKYFRDHVPQWAGSGTADLTPTDFYINQLLGAPAARSFESPFWWAAFSLTGV